MTKEDRKEIRAKAVAAEHMAQFYFKGDDLYNGRLKLKEAAEYYAILENYK